MKFSNIIQINASPEIVFHWLGDPDRAMQWMTSVTKYEIIKETSNMVGTTFYETIEENGRGTKMRGVVTDFVPNERFAVHLEGEFNSAKVDFVLKENGGMTQLTQNIELHFKGVLKLLGVFSRTLIRKKIISQAQNEFARLKEICEQHS